MAFARFGHFRFSDAGFNEWATDADSEQQKDFLSLDVSDKVFVEVAG